VASYNRFAAPLVACVRAPAELGPYGALECVGFVTALCLAAQARSVGTVPPAVISAYAPFVRDWFGLEGRLVLCAVSFGRADPDAPINTFRTDRETPDALIDWKDD